MGYDYDFAEAEYWANVGSDDYDDNAEAIEEYFEDAPTYVEYPQYSVKRGGIQFPMPEASPDRGEKMKSNDELATQAEQLRAEAERLEQILAAREKYGEDPFKNGVVLKVDMKYRNGPARSYAYGVVKIAGKFWLSGKLAATGAGESANGQPTGMTWEQFVGWLSQGDATVWQAMSLRQVL